MMLVIAATLMTCMLVRLEEGYVLECGVCGVMMVLVVMVESAWWRCAGDSMSDVS